MEDRASALEVAQIVTDFMPPAGASKVIVERAVAIMVYTSFTRRVFRSHPLLWHKLYPLLQRSLRKIKILERYDAASIGEMVRETARLCELPITALYGGGRHWFALEVDEDDEEDEELPAGELWLQHSIALLKNARSMCTNVAEILLSGTNDRATRMQEEIEKCQGLGRTLPNLCKAIATLLWRI